MRHTLRGGWGEVVRSVERNKRGRDELDGQGLGWIIPLMDVGVPPVVLVVEDETLVRLVAVDVLTDAGCRVIEAAGAQEAITVLEAGVDIDVLLADVDMPPGPNGFELARSVQRRWPHVALIVTSGRLWPQAGDLPEDAIFLAKPCPTAMMVAQVKAAALRARAHPGRTAAGPASFRRRA